jgi:hypothetical protein
MLSCTGVLVVGVTSVARERGRERERVPACVRLCLSHLPRLPLSTCVHVNVSVCQRESPPLCVNVPPMAPSLPLGGPWTSSFIDTRRCPAVQWGCSYVLAWLAEERLEPCTRANVAIGKCLEPCRSIVGGAAWILLTFACFRRGFESNRRHGRTRGTIITYCRSNLRWDTGLVPS